MRDFIDNEGKGLLPLKGNLSDMTADTEKYIALQQMYNINPEITVYIMMHKKVAQSSININKSFIDKFII